MATETMRPKELIARLKRGEKWVLLENSMETKPDEKRWMPSGKAPAHHEWRRWADGLWRCPWCDGFHASEQQPPKNAAAMNNFEAAKYGIKYEGAKL